jgi:phosphoglycerate kinase
MAQYPEKIVAPNDVAVSDNNNRVELDISQLPTEYPILDIGEKTIHKYAKLIETAKSIVLSGPLGVYEKAEFATGTRQTFKAVADNAQAFSLAGGGHTISALQQFGLSEKISYVSTAGGALIEFLMGKKLPGVAALENAIQTKKA